MQLYHADVLYAMNKRPESQRLSYSLLLQATRISSLTDARARR